MFVQDAFLFCNELDILEIRLHELFPVVDEFVIVEGTKTFSGHQKPLFFQNNKARYAPYSAKIKHVIFDNWPDDVDPWQSEFAQRDSLLCETDLLQPNDLIIFSDVDEIPSREAVSAMRIETARSFAFEQTFSYFTLDYLNIGLMLQDSCWSIAERKQDLKNFTVSDRRRTRHGRIVESQQAPADFAVIKNAGWHASYLGDKDFIVNKLRSFSHQEYNRADIIDNIDIARLIKNNEDLFGRDNIEWNVATSPIKTPHLVREQPQRFSKYFARESNLS